jgi:hypothetical protein
MHVRVSRPAGEATDGHDTAILKAFQAGELSERGPV